MKATRAARAPRSTSIGWLGADGAAPGAACSPAPISISRSRAAPRTTAWRAAAAACASAAARRARTTSASRARCRRCPACEPPITALCVVPFGMEEGTEPDVAGAELGLRGRRAGASSASSAPRRAARTQVGLLLDELGAPTSSRSCRRCSAALDWSGHEGAACRCASQARRHRGRHARAVVRRARRRPALEARVHRARDGRGVSEGVTPPAATSSASISARRTRWSRTSTPRAPRRVRRVFPIPQLVAEGERRRAPDAAVVRSTSPASTTCAAGRAGAAVATQDRALRGRRVRAAPQGERVAGPAGRVGEVLALPRRRRSRGGDPAVGRRPTSVAQAVAGRRVGARASRTCARRGTQRIPDAPLAEQDVVLTVPASFDEVARELTVAGGAAGRARRACACSRSRRRRSTPGSARTPATGASASPARQLGAGRRRRRRHDRLHRSSRVRRGGRAASALERIAVGDHLLLGGDNMDLALARAASSRALRRAASTQPALAAARHALPRREGAAARRRSAGRASRCRSPAAAARVDRRRAAARR